MLTWALLVVPHMTFLHVRFFGLTVGIISLTLSDKCAWCPSIVCGSAVVFLFWLHCIFVAALVFL